ncbi:MAG: 1-acyl-sn-glycerol-3-phosphate acyltransferase [Verrucomicrobia bacterium]|nr:1-acyl-sn-glycerol-3-phosphate acyltransferase [Verrucomicrobiota bacterium]
MIFLRVYHVVFYFLSLLLFALFGLTLNLFSVIAGWCFRDERGMQRLIHRHFALFVWWMRVMRLVDVQYRGFERITSGGQLVVANHPGLMDITFILARVREAVCVFKPAIRRNPVLGAAAGYAGYLGADRGPDLMRMICDKVRAGHTVVLFPEGTRTPPGETLGVLRPGFALVARRKGVPVQLVRITANPPVLAKGWAWWQVPRFPIRVEVAAGPRVLVPEEVEVIEAAARVERWFRTGEGPDLPLA